MATTDETGTETETDFETGMFETLGTAQERTEIGIGTEIGKGSETETGVVVGIGTVTVIEITKVVIVLDPNSEMNAHGVRGTKMELLSDVSIVELQMYLFKLRVIAGINRFKKFNFKIFRRGLHNRNCNGRSEEGTGNP